MLEVQARAWVRGDPEDDLADGVMPALSLHLDCVTFRSLPSEGGVLDQEYELMQDIRLVASVIEKESARQSRRLHRTG